MRMSVDRDATTTPVPDETIVRAGLRALIARPPLVVPALRAVTAHLVGTAPARPDVRAATKAETVLRAVMVPVLRAAMAST